MALQWGWKAICEKRYRALASSATLLLLFALFAGRDIPWLAAINNNEVMLAEAEHYMQRGEYDKAVAAYREVIETNPLSYDAHLGLGDILYKERRFIEAISEYRFAMKNEPSMFQVSFKIGMSYIESNNVNEAITEFEAVLERYPEECFPYLGLAVAYERKGVRDKARGYWNEYLKRDPRGEWSAVAATVMQPL